jgi:AcrR family transcriptional regulator
MANEKSYHHGNLRATLLVAAGAELAARGIEGFSLRQIAKRAGVSHAAPKYHFGNVRGLLTAFAVRGFENMLECIDHDTAILGSAATDIDRYFAVSHGYLRFAIENSAQFDVMFKVKLFDETNANLIAIRVRLEDMLKDSFKSVAAHLDKLQQDRLAHLICGTIHGLATLAVNISSSTNDQYSTAKDALTEFNNMLLRNL